MESVLCRQHEDPENSYRVCHSIRPYFKHILITTPKKIMKISELNEFTLKWTDQKNETTLEEILGCQFDSLYSKQLKLEFEPTHVKRSSKKIQAQFSKTIINKLAVTCIKIKNIHHIYSWKKNLLCICLLGCHSHESWTGHSRYLNFLNMFSNINYHVSKKHKELPRNLVICVSKRLTLLFWSTLSELICLRQNAETFPNALPALKAETNTNCTEKDDLTLKQEDYEMEDYCESNSEAYYSETNFMNNQEENLLETETGNDYFQIIESNFLEPERIIHHYDGSERIPAISQTNFMNNSQANSSETKDFSELDSETNFMNNQEENMLESANILEPETNSYQIETYSSDEINTNEEIHLTKFIDKTENSFVANLIKSADQHLQHKRQIISSIYDLNPDLKLLEVLGEDCLIHWIEHKNSLRFSIENEFQLQKLGIYHDINSYKNLIYKSNQPIPIPFQCTEKNTDYNEDNSSDVENIQIPSSLTGNSFKNDNIQSTSKFTKTLETNNSTVISENEDIEPIVQNNTSIFEHRNDVNTLDNSNEEEDPQLFTSINTFDSQQIRSEHFLKKFLIDDDTVLPLDEIWNYILEETDNKKRIVDFLPILPEVDQFVERICIKRNNILIYLKEFLYKNTSLTKNGNKGHVASEYFNIIKRFFSFAQMCLQLVGKKIVLDLFFCRNVKNSKIVIPFFIEILKQDRTHSTIEKYRRALNRMADFLKLCQISTDFKENVGLNELLDCLLVGRKTKDQERLLNLNLEKTQIIEEFNTDDLKKLVSIVKIQEILDSVDENLSFRNKENREKFMLAQGAIAFLLRSMNASHTIDILYISITMIQHGLRKAEKNSAPYIVLPPLKRFKNSANKTDTVVKLSLPKRYHTILQKFVEMRKRFKIRRVKNQQNLFINVYGLHATRSTLDNTIKNYVESLGFDYLGATVFRDIIETIAEGDLNTVRSNSIELHNIESTRLDLHESLLHNAATAKKYYIYPSDKQAVARTTFIDSTCFNSNEKQLRSNSSEIESSDMDEISTQDSDIPQSSGFSNDDIETCVETIESQNKVSSLPSSDDTSLPSSDDTENTQSLSQLKNSLPLNKRMKLITQNKFHKKVVLFKEDNNHFIHTKNYVDDSKIKKFIECENILEKDCKEAGHQYDIPNSSEIDNARRQRMRKKIKYHKKRQNSQ